MQSSFASLCCRRSYANDRNACYSSLSRYPPSKRTFQRSVSDGVHNFQENSNSETSNGSETLHKIVSRRSTTTDMYRSRVPSESSQSTDLKTFGKSMDCKESNIVPVHNTHSQDLLHKNLSKCNVRQNRDKRNPLLSLLIKSIYKPESIKNNSHYLDTASQRQIDDANSFL